MLQVVMATRIFRTVWWNHWGAVQPVLVPGLFQSMHRVCWRACQQISLTGSMQSGEERHPLHAAFLLLQVASSLHGGWRCGVEHSHIAGSTHRHDAHDTTRLLERSVRRPPAADMDRLSRWWADSAISVCISDGYGISVHYHTDLECLGLLSRLHRDRSWWIADDGLLAFRRRGSSTCCVQGFSPA